MEQKISPIINPEELIALSQSSPIIIIDVSAGADAKTKYTQQHLKGTLFANLNTDLAHIMPDAANGGRHPLPGPDQFAAVLTRLGITPTTHVILYDDKNGSNAAARLWWMLRSIGHKKVQVINGGLNAAIAAGFPVSSNEEQALITEPYGEVNWELPLSSIQEVENVAANSDFLIIDVRDKERYNGEKEPIDLVAGHIPGAVNIPFAKNLDSKGFFLPPAELKRLYEDAMEHRTAENVIVHCGSGVTACHTLLAMDYAGMLIPKLYVGSWSEWSRNNKPMATLAKEQS
ncbi:MAG TPA: sulfurtransferase [Chitinophagaceae bacterium]